MSLIVKITPRQNVLHVGMSGEFVLDEAEGNFLEVIDWVKEHQCEKVLVDGRKVGGDPSIIERFFYGEFASRTVKRLQASDGFNGSPQFAYVLHEPVLDPLRFGETVMVNRGMLAKVFDNLDEAVEWLGLTPEEI